MSLLRNRWLMLVAGIWIQVTTGSSYVFGLYSESLKQSLGYSQTQLDTLGFAKSIGANVGVHTGLLYLVVPPWVILLLGIVHNLSGYLLIWLAGTHLIRHVKFWQMFLFMLIASNAQTYFNTAVVVTSVTNFPASRGTVIGLMKGCLGLSGAILTFFYKTFHSPNEKNQISYLLFAATAPSLTCLVLMFFIRPVTPGLQRDAREQSTLSSISGIALGLAFCLIPVTILGDVKQGVKFFLSALLLAALALPLVVALRAGSQAQDDERKLLIGESNRTREDESSSSPPSLEEQEEHTLMQAFTSLDFWLLFLSTGCAMGSGLTAIDNVNQLGSSLGYSARDVSVVVSLLSIWNFLGRFGAGAVSDYFLRTRGVPRPAFISLTLGVMALGHLVIAAAVPGALYVGILVVGLCYGSQWSLMPATVSEIFGMKQFGTLFNTVAIASPLGELLLSVNVAGYLYDKEARKQGSTKLTCSGAHCFRLTFIIMAGMCLLGCACTSVMVSRTRRYYNKVFHKNYAA